MQNENEIQHKWADDTLTIDGWPLRSNLSRYEVEVDGDVYRGVMTDPGWDESEREYHPVIETEVIEDWRVQDQVWDLVYEAALAEIEAPNV